MDNRENLKILLKEGKKLKCEICNIENWQGKPLRLQIHHIDGNRSNNNLENLQILCPNCHSQTDNFCSKNRARVPKPTCKQCGKEISRTTKNNLCIECTRNIERSKSKCPNREQLILDCQTIKTYYGIAKKYKVSDKTIRKWCDKLNINIKNI